jgi:hypothetical protein
MDSDFVTYMAPSGRTEQYPKNKLNPLKSIRLKCLDCSGGKAEGEASVKDCVVPDCPLYPFRFGKGFKRTLTDEQRAVLSERAKRMAVARRSDKNAHVDV